MAEDHPNVQLFRRMFDAFASGDTDAAADGVVWHAAGANPLAGKDSGREAVFQFPGREFELSDGTYEVEVHDVLGNDEHVVAMTRARAQRGGKALDQRYVMVLTSTTAGSPRSGRSPQTKQRSTRSGRRPRLA